VCGEALQKVPGESLEDIRIRDPLSNLAQLLLRRRKAIQIRVPELKPDQEYLHLVGCATIEQYEQANCVEQEEVADLIAECQSRPIICASVFEEILWEMDCRDESATIFRADEGRVLHRATDAAMLAEVIHDSVCRADQGVLGNDIPIREEHGDGRFELSARHVEFVDDKLLPEQRFGIESMWALGHGSASDDITPRFSRRWKRSAAGDC
jgi:hypothetical protein